MLENWLNQCRSLQNVQIKSTVTARDRTDITCKTRESCFFLVQKQAKGEFYGKMVKCVQLKLGALKLGKKVD